MAQSGDLFTEDDCKAVLSNYVKSKGWKYVSLVMEVMSGVEGFAGLHFKIKIQYEDSSGPGSQQFFLKVLDNSTKVLFDMCLSLNAYEKEELLYKTLIEDFKRREIDTSFAAESYLCRPYLIVLEDVTLRGYRNSPKKDMLNVEHCKVALKALAHFHASAIVYEERKSKEQNSPYRVLDAHPDYLGEKLFSKSENAAATWLKCTLPGLLQIIDLLPENEISGDDFKNRLLKELETCYEIAKPSDKFRNTILHGDLWSNNFMFRYEEGEKPVDGVLIDYQLLKYGTPASDVMQMILTNVRRSLRAEFYDELLESYYEKFAEYLSGHGLNANGILSKGDFFESCDEFKIIAKLQAIVDHSVTFLVDEVVLKAFESEDQLEAFLFRDRSEGMTNSYKTCDLYREVLQEDLIELRDWLFPN